MCRSLRGRHTGANITAGTAETGQVRLADRVVALAAVKRHPDRYTSLFGRARSEVGYAVCLCRTDQVVRLVIRCRSGRYHLANWPSGGHQHTPGCPWYRSPSSVSGRSACSEAITTTAEGTSVRLSDPLTVRGASAPAAEKSPAPAGNAPSTARHSMGLLALLHFLWEGARLNVWHPRKGQRTWRTCHALLDEQAADCRVNRLALADTLWIVPPFQREHADRINTAWERFLSRLTRASRIRRRGLILGEIRAIEPTDYGMRIRLAHQRAPLFASTQLMERVRRSYPSVFSEQASQPGRRQVVLCLVERSPRGYPMIVDLAAMLTTSSYLPADSSFEAEMADALETAGRAFVKPLHYDGGSVFPDFVLIDDDPETYVEVWGVRGRELYEARKRAKQSIYRDSGRALLEWDVREPLPDLSR
jgi:Protein of unknown function (DUF1173)